MSVRREQPFDADVVVVGSGPVGSALGVCLGTAGVRTIVIESRHAGEAPHPGTNLSNVRTMEHFRHWGATEFVAAANTLGPDVSRDVHFVTRGNGHMIVNFESAMEFSEQMPFASAGPHFGPQASIEDGLRARMATLDGCEVRFSSTYEHFVQHADRVDVTYRDAGGTERVLACRYLVGADGGRSSVRKDLGLSLEGTPCLVRGTIWYIQSEEIKRLLDGQFGSASMVWFVNEDHSGVVLAAQDGAGRFQFFTPVPDDFDGNDWEAAKRSLINALGTDVQVEPLEGGELQIRSMVAPRFSDHRVFLAGESAHLISVFGGFGMNTGSPGIDVGDTGVTGTRAEVGG